MFRIMQVAVLFAIMGGVAIVFMGVVLGVPIPGLVHEPKGMEIKPPSELGVQLVGEHTLAVPVEVRSTLGIRKKGKDEIELVHTPTQTRPLTLYGSTALDPTRLMRIRARFAPAEVVSIGTIEEPGPKGTITRELRPGDWVKKGDVLGVFFSVDVGSKKNDLLDALVQLILDQEILDRVEKARGTVPEVFVLNQVRAVQGDRNAQGVEHPAG
jgi:cobalt-zinc-cadmium efflux system membrane fusion protein